VLRGHRGLRLVGFEVDEHLGDKVKKVGWLCECFRRSPLYVVC
jgi:hypothetical protein